MVGIKRVVKFSKLKNSLNSKQTEYSNESNRLKIEKQKERERERERERMGQNIQNIWEKIAENFLYNIVNLFERAQKQLFAVVLM